MLAVLLYIRFYNESTFTGLFCWCHFNSNVCQYHGGNLAGIGMKTEVAGMSSIVFTFSLILLIGAVLSKVIGCGLGAKLCRYENKEALSVGIGMISRGEVALIVAQKGAQIGLISLQLFPAIVLVVIGTTMLTPILLKLQMK